MDVFNTQLLLCTLRTKEDWVAGETLFRVNNYVHFTLHNYDLLKKVYLQILKSRNR